MFSVQLADRARSQSWILWIHGGRIWPLTNKYSIYPSSSPTRWSVNAAHGCFTLVLGQHCVTCISCLFIFLPWLQSGNLSADFLTQIHLPSSLGFLSVHALSTQCMAISSCPVHPLLLPEVSWYCTVRISKIPWKEMHSFFLFIHIICSEIRTQVTYRKKWTLHCEWEHWLRALALKAVKWLAAWGKQACSCYLRASIHLQIQS